MSAAAVEVVDVSHAFGGVRALDAVSLTVAPGAFVSVVGPSGCGKSTLLKILAGVLVPDAGTATIGGASTVGRPGPGGYMPQRDLLLPWKRALDNACLAVDVASGSTRAERARARERAGRLWARFGLAGFERAWPAELSGGMRQRLALLRTYLTDAPVLLLDEPFGALDAITRRDLQCWLQGLWRADDRDAADDGLGSARRSCVFVTHDIDEALFMSDTVHVMSARPGRIVDSVDVGVPRPREPAVVTTPAFGALEARLLAALDGAR